MKTMAQKVDDFLCDVPIDSDHAKRMRQWARDMDNEFNLAFREPPILDRLKYFIPGLRVDYPDRLKRWAGDVDNQYVLVRKSVSGVEEISLLQQILRNED